jgi:rhamnulokinase
MKVISIDLGATSGRVMTVSYDGMKFSYAENARFANRTYLDKDNILRWDFSYLIRNVIDGVKKALEESPDAKSISIDTWAVDYGLIKDGKLLSDPMCYRDVHSFDSQKDILARMPFEEIYRRVGIQNLHFNTIYQLAFDRENVMKADCLLMIPDLIAYYLTGEMRIELTNASTTSLYSFRDGCFDKELLKLIGIDEKVFPEMIVPGEKYGMLKKDISSLDIPVVACPSHDTASAVLGASGKGTFAYISSGTWSLIGTELSEVNVSEKGFKANFTNEVGYANTIRYLKNTMGMFLINEVRNDYQRKGKEIKVAEIVSLIKDSKDIHSYLDVDSPCFEAPGNMIGKVMTYLEETKQDKPENPGEMFRMIYKSMALRYRVILSSLEDIIGKKFSSIIVVGGGNQASYLNQAVADACKIKVITGASEATVMGNALSQFIALGAIKDVSEGREKILSSFPSETFDPVDSAYYDMEMQGYEKIIRK